jgi:predicted Rossmann fold flavoprotein
MHQKRLVVIGGGAAGFFCAVNAARMNPMLEVIIVEKTNKLLSKVRISGGGRCNATHACFEIDKMSKRYPRGTHFVRKAFHQFFTKDTIHWFKERGVELKKEADGRMFPVTDSSQTIIDCLLQEATRYGVRVQMGAEVKSIDFSKKGFQLGITNNQTLEADYVCIACGGYPKAAMFDWLRTSGHTILGPVPSLFTFNLPGHPITKLMGVSVEKAGVKINGTRLQEAGPLLITHWGLSGPAVLRLSAWGARELANRQWKFSISVNWLPDHTEQTLQGLFQSYRHDHASQKVINRNLFGLPQRLWEFLVEQAAINEAKRWADVSGKEQNKLIQLLCRCEFDVAGKTTFKEEFVTAGGIHLSEVDANTMMSKKIENLFFAGEILDVDGITGGYNFQHAWTSGFIAAKAIANMSVTRTL